MNLRFPLIQSLEKIKEISQVAIPALSLSGSALDQIPGFSSEVLAAQPQQGWRPPWTHGQALGAEHVL